MVRRYFSSLTLAALAVLGARVASADAIQLTGNVERDFSLKPGSGTSIIVDNPNPDGTSNPNDVAQAKWITDQGWTTGWNIKDVRLHYDQATDTMAVGVNFFGIAGDVDGNGSSSVADPRTLAAGGVKMPHLGGRESITVGIDTTNSGMSNILAGVPADKSTAGPGIDGFTVASRKMSNEGIAYSYGKTLTDHLGGLAFDPNKAHPGFEFTIAKFSTLPGLDPARGFGIEAFAGSPDDVIAGEDFVSLRHLPMPQVVHVPEPTTWLAWSLVAGASAFGLRRKRGGSVEPRA